jgi:hypothetical protein
MFTVLGQGGQWAPVTGFDGTMNEFQFGGTADKASNEDVEDPFSPEVSVRKIPGLPLPLHRRHHSDSEAAMMDELATIDKQQPPTLADSVLSEDPIPTTHIGGSDIVQQVGKRGRPFSQAHVYVGKKHGDGIFVDDPAFLAEWSVDAMKLIRRHLWRAGNGGVPIPGEANWPVAAADTTSADDTLPAWAGERPSGHYKFDDEIVPASPDDTSVTITDLPLMVDEVCDLLDVMEGMMAIQRRRRLDLLRPPSWVRCNWYVLAAVAPPAAYLVGRLVTRGYGKKVVSLFVEKVADFFRERIVTPVVSMYVAQLPTVVSLNLRRQLTIALSLLKRTASRRSGEEEKVTATRKHASRR